MPPSPPSAATLPAGRVAGVGSPALRSRLAGPPASGTVVHAGDHAVYARFPDGVVGVVARSAVHVPAAISTTLLRLPTIPVGAPAALGDGTLRVGPLTVGVDRLVATDVPALADPVAAGCLLADVLPDLAVVRRQLPATALDDLAAGDPAAVLPLVGRGDGLTPVGDDVLAGWLVTARAAGRPTSAMAAAVAAAAERTTDLSATLLAHAADGAAIPPFRALLLALAAGAGAGTAAAALAAVGHTSGAGMLLGASLALTPAPETPEGSPR